MKLTALIATRDTLLYSALRFALIDLGFEVLLTSDDVSTLRSLSSVKPTLLVLHELLPLSGGIEVCRKLRGNKVTADILTLIITAGPNASERIAALNAGADDCMSPPLQLDEFTARIQALQRRTTILSSSGYLRAGPVEMDTERWIVKVQGQIVDLTRMEFQILQALLEAKGRALNRDALLRRISPHSVTQALDTRTVDVHIGRLRGKLGPAGHYIVTIRNVGFRFDIVPEWVTARTMTKRNRT